MNGPLVTQWDGEAFHPLRRHAKECDARFAIGERYVVNVEEVRSEAAHRSYFASIAEVWKNLSDDQAARFPTPEHLRKFALIEAGFANRKDIVCANNAEALRLAAMVHEIDSYSVTLISQRAVAIWTAESQSYKAMGRKRFSDSQNAVREFCAKLLDVASDSLPAEEAA